MLTKVSEPVAAVTIWALFGTAIRIYLDRPRIKRGVTILLTLLLVYFAMELSRLVDLLKQAKV